MRYRGTIGGNVANGDPGNDMPALMMTLGTSYRLEGKAGAREVTAAEFYQGAYFTALKPGELLTSIRVRLPPAGSVGRFFKFGTRPALDISAIEHSRSRRAPRCRSTRIA